MKFKFRKLVDSQKQDIKKGIGLLAHIAGNEYL